MFYKAFGWFLEVLPWVFPAFFLVWIVLSVSPAALLAITLFLLWTGALLLDRPSFRRAVRSLLSKT